MIIDIQARNFSLTKALRSYAERRLNLALNSGKDHIHRVVIRLSDINGPRGGVDKKCHLQIQLTGLPDVVVEDTELDMYTSIDRACDRVSRTVVRKLGRQQTLLRQTP
ncbi:MAG: HPF/RaiA family ribosome-associated protein, partial [Gammaproteobacteria bacterium]|nr:HPF/RaiA family ribosome-associated protein [Gammaproteobacteria bacterium]